ncbi:MAG: two pore domain potassium channel family protein [Actinobacteria bacterium]|nr:two pore domain potassium channel family protein [Actinomycetota bacterium]
MTAPTTACFARHTAPQRARPSSSRSSGRWPCRRRPAFTQDLDLFTSYYFCVTVLGTVGLGDTTPVTTFARSVSMAQMVVDRGSSP